MRRESGAHDALQVLGGGAQVHISFSVPFCAGKQRPRFTKSHAYKTSDETMREQAIALAFEEAGGIAAPKGVPVSVTISASKAGNDKNGKEFTTKPDADNIAKLVLDALNGKAWHDDAQIVGLRIEKIPLTKNVSRIHVDIDWRD